MYFYPVMIQGNINVSVQFHTINPYQKRGGDWDTTWRQLPNILIERPHGGQWSCLYEGGQVVVADGQALVVPVGCRHRLVKLSRGLMHSDWVYCSCLLSDGRDLALGPKPMVLQRNQANTLDECLAQEDLHGAGLRAQASILRLMSYCLDQIDGPDQEPDDRIAQVIVFMRASLDQDLDRDQLAAVCHLSPTRFHDVFVAATGVAPMRYLTRLRLQRAQHLLQSTSFSVGRIADSCGFQSQAYFNRVFKRAFGQSPGAYRMSFNETSI